MSKDNATTRKDFKDLTGMVFGTIKVISLDIEKSNPKKKIWFCECTETGTKRKFQQPELTSGRATSIGRGSHGFSNNPIYVVWEGMRSRCNNPKSDHYKNYGGRGIKICKEWDNFENFMTDMGKRPINGTIDRINNNGDYEKNNCRWASRSVQNNNSRHNVIVHFRGDKMTMTEFANKFGFTPKNVQHLMTTKGKTAEWVYAYYKNKGVGNGI